MNERSLPFYNKKMHILEEKQLRDAFDLLDEDHDGFIPVNDLIQVLTQVRLNRKSQIAFELISNFKNIEKKVSVENFIEIVQGNFGKLVTREGLRKVFDRYDKKGDGWIGGENIEKVMKDLGENMDKEEVEQLLESVHILKKTEDKDKLEFEDFYSLMVSKHY